ncbi:TetR/AcrR family transcriptional regulator [Paenibacillus sp. DMB20]|uniref:TetR/AcrR family transcriptional regulator n=1 Tax=Paenibacillus sp. DMB20 TaxID=1642570 RepID=UPI000627C8CC|nr:TetR/AcrR family transcriptional regulator [Paenibacillus sp. DMB20]KKO51697.1 TetR family transcriptional regulator [Paenibacillus sp. DMB20]
MSLLKEKILQSAIRFFAEKGYQATSIQDIADDCSIAKGSIYKYYGSKEELYISILQKRQQDMIDAVENIRKRELPRRETFLEEIAYQFDFFIEHGYYISRDHNELPPANSDKIGSVIHQLQLNMFRYYQDILIRHYGNAISEWKWDVTAIFNGLIREYTFHVLFGFKPLVQKELAAFIAERMDDLVQGLAQRSPRPLLTDELMKEYSMINLEALPYTQEIRRAALMDMIESIIPDLPITNSRKKDLSEVAVMLREEFINEHPRNFLIQALLRDLSSENELGFYTSQLQQFIRDRNKDH